MIFPPNSSEPKKKRQRIYDLLNAKTKPKKNSEKIEVSLWSLSTLDHNTLDYAILDVLKNKTNATSHQNNVLLNTAIKNYGIKCLQNLF